MRFATAIICGALTVAAGIGGICGELAVAAAQDCPGNPDAIGTSRTIAISPADYPRVGTIQYPQSLPLDDHEVVLTFDDGPLPRYTDPILDILAAQCVKATFFIVGSMARAYPAAVRREREAGHTLGTHSENHPTRFDKLPVDELRQEIDGGIADVGAAAGDPKALAPFFRIPGIARSDLIEEELATRSLTVFSADAMADDWHRHITPAKIVSLAVERLEKKGKGILLLHDIHPWTVAALPDLLKELKAHGFHIVQVVPAGPGVPETIATIPGVTVAWSMTAQEVLDGTGAKPLWPNFVIAPPPGQPALPTPDAAAFKLEYLFAPAASTARIATASATADAGSAFPWPRLDIEQEPSSPEPQLGAPSLADIGWPITAKPPAEHAMNGAADKPPRAAAQDRIHIRTAAHPHIRDDRRKARDGGRSIAHRRGRMPAGERQHADVSLGAA